MEVIVQWATILSPIIAVLIAWWMSKSSAKGIAKQINALEQSTKKQVESIKKLAKIQAKTSQIQINKELHEARMRYLQAIKKQGDNIEFEHFFNQFGSGADAIRQRDEKEREVKYEIEFYKQYAQALEQYQSSVYALSKELGEE